MTDFNKSLSDGVGIVDSISKNISIDLAESVVVFDFKRGDFFYTGHSLTTNNSFTDFLFSSDGFKVFTLESGVIIEYVLSTAFDLSSGIASGVSFSDFGGFTPKSITFSGDGLNLYVSYEYYSGDPLQGNYTKVLWYSLSVAWDLSTAIYSNVSSQITNRGWSRISSDGTKFFLNVRGFAASSMRAYNLTVPYDITTLSYINLIVISPEISANICFSADGKKLMGKKRWADGVEDSLVIFSLNNAWNIFGGYSVKEFGNAEVSDSSIFYLNENKLNFYINDSSLIKEFSFTPTLYCNTNKSLSDSVAIVDNKQAFETICINSWSDLNEIRDKLNTVNYILTKNLSKEDDDYYTTLFPGKTNKGEWEAIAYDENDLVLYDNLYYYCNNVAGTSEEPPHTDWTLAQGWVPIDEVGVNFGFDGKGFTINDLYSYGGDDVNFIKGNGEVMIYNIDFINCHFEGNNYIGLFGKDITGEIKDCNISGMFIGNDYVGGFSPYCNNLIVNKIKVLVTVEGTGSYIGGFIGYDELGYITECCSEGVVSGTNYIGGFIGKSNTNNISNCYSQSIISGDNIVGGFVGEHNNEYSSMMDKCYAAGRVTGIINLGGFSAVYTGSETSTDCFYDYQSSEQVTSAYGVSKTTSEMFDITTFENEGWDISSNEMDTTSWYIVDDYPILRYIEGKIRFEDFEIRNIYLTSFDAYAKVFSKYPIAEKGFIVNGTKYIDEDLNKVFSGYSEGDSFIVQVYASNGTYDILTEEISFSLAEVIDEEYVFTGAPQELIIPVTGFYEFKVWGAKGGNSSNTVGGKGGYAYGKKLLHRGDVLNIYVGGAGARHDSINQPGGWNGGGNGASTVNSAISYRPGTGGGASDIRLNNNDLEDRFIVGAGGGGAGSRYTGANYNGGAGGGLVGLNATSGGTGGTQSGGGSVGGTLGLGGTSNSSIRGAGGGGYYGGGRSNTNYRGGGGGSSYIEGLIDGETVEDERNDNGLIQIKCLSIEKIPVELDELFLENITVNSMTASSSVVDMGSELVIKEYGFVYSLNPNPDLTDDYVTAETFFSLIDSLIPYRIYYIRGYVKAYTGLTETVYYTEEKNAKTLLVDNYFLLKTVGNKYPIDLRFD